MGKKNIIFRMKRFIKENIKDTYESKIYFLGFLQAHYQLNNITLSELAAIIEQFDLAALE